MSGEKTTSCSKFQANIFNKSKCQNCFKSRELHLLTDHDMEQAKPLYGGWLCLAPEGTDFDNPMQKSRKWQRRFFILYEDGSLSFALDELPSTLPQGTLNMNQCVDISDAEPRTGQRNALCVATPQQEIYIRGDNKEIINGWSEQLAVYPRTNKQNQKKKRKVEPVTSQEPSPAKIVATAPSFPSSESSESGWWQEDQVQAPGQTTMWPVPDPDPPGLEKTPAGNASSYLSPVSLDLVSGNTNNTNTTTNNNSHSTDKSHGGPAERILGTEEREQEEPTSGRKGRSEARTNRREKLQASGDKARLGVAPPTQRRAKSLDRRTSDTVMTPDLLNFKKGWMVKLDENEQWKKYWFVLSTDNLRYYKDSMAEEASDLEGEIDLTKCFNVSEYQVQRNYGFQIHTPKGVYTLSAMTSGIRKNWIQALMKNVRPANAPDVASLPGLLVPCSPPEVLPKPDVTPRVEGRASDPEPHPKPRSVTERRREGRYKTFDWAEFRPQTKRTADPPRSKAPGLLELGDLERRKRREERRRRYETMLGIPLGWEASGDKAADDGDGVRALSPKSQQKVEEEMEEYWRQVESTVFRMERSVQLKETQEEEVEKLLDGYRKAVEDLKAQLAESESLRLDLEARLNSAGLYHQQPDPPVPSKPEDPLSSSTQILEDGNSVDTQVQISTAPQTPSVWLHDADGNFQELEGFLNPADDATLLISPASDDGDLFSQSNGQTVDMDEGLTLDGDDGQRLPQAETQITNEYSSLILETPSDGDDDSLSCCVEPPDQDQAVVERLSHEVELLTGQNAALNQRNQEMLNQLTEADREIERLKAELSSRYTEPHHLPEVEQQRQVKVEDLERELGSREQQLLQAQAVISSLEENLKEMEALLQLNAAAAEPEAAEQENKTYLLRCFEATEAKLTELERQLHQSEDRCRELQTQNAGVKEAENVSRQAAEEAEAHVRRLTGELEKERLKDGGGGGGGKRSSDSVSGDGRIRQVIDGMVTRLEAVEKLLEVIDKLELRKEEEEKEPSVESQIRWEEEFWRSVGQKLKVDPPEEQLGERRSVEELLGEMKSVEEKRSVEELLGERKSVEESKTVEELLGEKRSIEELLGEKRSVEELLSERRSVEELLSEVTERMVTEKQMLLLGHRLLPSGGGDGVEDLDVIRLMAEETEETRTFDFYKIEHFKDATRMKISFLNRLASSVGSSAQEHLHLTESHFPEHPWSGFIHSAATEALHCCYLNRLKATYQQRLEETKHNLVCSHCVHLTEENRKLRERLTEVEEQQEEKVNSWSQTEEPEVVEEEEKKMEIHEEDEASLMETDTLGSDEVSALRRRVEELEEQLALVEEDMKAVLDGKMSSQQAQHEKETEKFKATCERGFASMEESHLKVVEELQHRHQQEVQRLLLERDRLLKEESAFTATAIEAITNAHRVELEKEAQRRSRTESGGGNTDLEDVCRLHSEELASYQRELQVLSQQFSQKCLENGHLVQALDAERKALCQCQQENQDLRTRNQELSGHLAAEITRLCSLAKQDALPLSPGMDVYEMEITLRVKESEVQCLKQEITSLRDDLQSAQRDKRNATKKYKDVYTELSITRAKAERELEDLKENLRLAHEALHQDPEP